MNWRPGNRPRRIQKTTGGRKPEQPNLARFASALLLPTRLCLTLVVDMAIIKLLLLLIEIGAVVIAAIYAIMWALNPGGPFELLAIVALLLGAAEIEIIRRCVPQVPAG